MLLALFSFPYLGGRGDSDLEDPGVGGGDLPLQMLLVLLVTSLFEFALSFPKLGGRGDIDREHPGLDEGVLPLLLLLALLPFPQEGTGGLVFSLQIKKISMR